MSSPLTLEGIAPQYASFKGCVFFSTFKHDDSMCYVHGPTASRNDSNERILMTHLLHVNSCFFPQGPIRKFSHSNLQEL